MVAWGEGVRLRSATIVPDRHEGYLGSVLLKRLSTSDGAASENDHAAARRLLEPRIVVDLAGAIAERKSGRRYDWVGARTDLANASNAATYCVTSERESVPYIGWLWARAAFRVDFHWPAIETVAAVLLDRDTLDADDLRELLSRSL